MIILCYFPSFLFTTLFSLFLFMYICLSDSLSFSLPTIYILFSLSLSHLFHIAPVITGGGYLPGTGPNITVRESDGLARVCAKLSGIANPSLSAPVNFTFTPTGKDGVLHPAQSKFN